MRYREITQRPAAPDTHPFVTDITIAPAAFDGFRAGDRGSGGCPATGPDRSRRSLPRPCRMFVCDDAAVRLGALGLIDDRSRRDMVVPMIGETVLAQAS